MDGIYTELRYLFESEYPGVNMFSAKLGAPEHAPVEAVGYTVIEEDDNEATTAEIMAVEQMS